MKRIIIIFVMTTVLIYALGGLNETIVVHNVKSNKVVSLEKKLEKIRKEIIQIEENKIKYNQLMTEYKTVSSQYQNLIDECSKIDCLNETKKLNQNFRKLKKSIETLNGMMEADDARMSSLKIQEEALKAMIRMEKLKANLRKEEVEKVINEM